jgi:hypothetical protein
MIQEIKIYLQFAHFLKSSTSSKYCPLRGRRGRDRMVVGFAITYAISAYHHRSCEFEPRSWRGVVDSGFLHQ